MTAKPSDIQKVWAATGATIKPTDAKISLGWEAEIPTYQNMNWLQNLLSQFATHVNEEGIPVWDSATDYPVGAKAKGSDGVTYRGLTTPNVNNDPVSSPVDWVVADFNPNYYTDSGAANAYVVSPTNNTEAPEAYVDGMPVLFRPDFSNTGASTVNVDSLGVKSIKTAEGADPAAGIIVAGKLLNLIYDAANGWFEIASFGGGGGQYLGTTPVKAIAYNAQSINEDITIAADQNALSAGPIEIGDGFTVTVSDGAVWTVI